MRFYKLWLKRILFSSQTLFQFSSLFSLCGLVLAVSSLTVALLAINGFSSGLQSVLIDKQGHVLIQGEKPLFKDELLDNLSPYKNQFKNQLLFFKFEGLLVKDQSFKGVLVEAIEDQKLKELPFFKNRIVEGSLQSSNSQFVIVGSELAKQLNLSVGSSLSLVVSNSQEDWFFRKQAQFELAGIIDFGKHEFNSFFVLMPLSSAQALGFHKVSGIKLWLKDESKSTQLSQQLSQTLPESYRVQSWRSADPVFFEIIQSDKKIIFFVLIILVISAGFNISSSLFVQIFRRTKEINLLKAMGLQQSSLRNLFFLNGLILGFVGTSLGIILGLLICFLLIFLQNKWQLIPSQTYHIHEIIWDWQSLDIFLIFCVSMSVIVMASFLPARKAYKMSIKRALSYD